MNDSVKKIVDAFATKSGYLVLRRGSEIILRHISDANTENMKVLFCVETGRVSIISELWSLCSFYESLGDAIEGYIQTANSMNAYYPDLISCVKREAKTWNISPVFFKELFDKTKAFEINRIQGEVDWHEANIKKKKAEIEVLQKLIQEVE